MNKRDFKWNRVEGPKGFDSDSILPFRERLIVCYIREGIKGIGEAYIDGGIWYWWDNGIEIQKTYNLVLWTLFPLLGNLKDE